MELTEKCKEEFEKWKKDRWMDSGLIPVDTVHSHIVFDVSWGFNLLPESMQYGVLVDYFDSVGIEIYNLKTISELLDKKNKKCYYIEELNTRPEARTQAIEKADELRNEVLNK